MGASAQWTKGKNKGYYKLGAWYLEADEHFTDTGEIDPNATRINFNLTFYGEHGLTDRLDALAYLPFFARVAQNDQVSATTGQTIMEGEAVNSIGDIDLGLRYGLLKTDKLALAVALWLGLPTGESQGGSDGSYQTGDGEFNQLFKLSLGIPFSLWNVPAYAKVYAGYNNRTDGFSDEVRAGAELGVRPIKNLWLSAKSDLVESTQNGDRSALNSQGSIFANNIEYLSIGGEAAYYFTDTFGASFNATGAFSGRIIYAAPTLSFGVFLDIQ